jgi:hypothetical protein
LVGLSELLSNLHCPGWESIVKGFALVFKFVAVLFLLVYLLILRLFLLYGSLLLRLRLLG